jgi:uncharacterized protein with PIN domain
LSVRLYMDVHVPRAITEGLRLRGVDVLTAQEDGARALSDPELLNWDTSLGRVLFTRDTDLLAEATERQRTDRSFTGLVYAHQLHVTIGRCVHDLELIARTAEPDELAGRVEYLPLR